MDASFVEQQVHEVGQAEDEKRASKRRKLLDGAVDVSGHSAADDADDGNIVLCRVIVNLVS